MISQLISLAMSVVFTIIVVAFLQVPMGQGTMDDHVYDWIHTSAFGTHLRKSVEGGIFIFGEVLRGSTSSMEKAASQFPTPFEKVDHSRIVSPKKSEPSRRKPPRRWEDE